ncbi:MAG: hypothetical protein IJK60_00595 [Clostridia bacterium]|nr:hypothetical protein [Clostridia bacterium]
MKKRNLFFILILLTGISLALSGCAGKEAPVETSLSAEELSENQSLFDNRFDFDYQFAGDKRAVNYKAFTEPLKEVYISLPEFKSKEDIDVGYISDFFIRFFSGIDPYSFDSVEGEDGRTYAAVSTDRVYSLLFYMLRVDDYKMPAKDENPDFYAQGENAFVLINETDGSAYHITKEVDDETGCYIILTKGKNGSDAPEYRVDFAQDEYGCYISSITV